MRTGNVIESVSAALYSALLRDLPEIGSRTWILAGKEHQVGPRRPTEEDVEVWSFPEQWGSTALGYGGMGGSTMTTAGTVSSETVRRSTISDEIVLAQTTIVACRATDSATIYWGSGGRLGRVMTYQKARELVDAQRSSR